MTTMLERGVDAPDVASLVRRAAEGDRRAWEGLVDQYARLIWSITVEFKLTESDAADVVQTTWLRLLQHIDRIQYPDRVGSWLAATARNECLRSLAAQRRSCSATMTKSSRASLRMRRRSTSVFSLTSEPKSFATRSPVCPGGGSGC